MTDIHKLHIELLEKCAEDKRASWLDSTLIMYADIMEILKTQKEWLLYNIDCGMCSTIIWRYKMLNMDTIERLETRIYSNET
jgi:hypothetical protein